MALTADLAIAAPVVTAVVEVPGTCGEWVQGTLDGVPCLVSCAIDWRARVTVSLSAAIRRWELPAGKPKLAAALRLALADRQDPQVGGRVLVANPLPGGRGYASSTADVAGAILALGIALGRPFEPYEVARLAVQVEPSDSTMYPAPALLAHLDAAFARPLDRLPPLAVVVLDPGGAVDTVAYNRLDRRGVLRSLAGEHREMFDEFEAALAAYDPAGVARAATRSALLHQAILPSDLVERAYGLARDLGALGICRAHSGTLAGLICDPGAAPEVATRAAAALPGLTVRVHRALGAGEGGDRQRPRLDGPGFGDRA